MGTDTGKERRRFNVVRGVAGGLGMALLVGLLGPAQATFHLMSIVEVFAGTPAAPNAQYVVLQMYQPGQNLLNGHDFVIYNASGQVISTFVFSNNVSNGANQAHILIATPEARTFFNVVPDFTMPAQLMKAGGKVCFADGIDCVAWGAYTGSAAGVGTPFNRSGGLNTGRAMARRLDIAGGGGTLDAADDTDDCANDFRFDIPEPKNNAGNSGHAPANTCGNRVLEGLEQCDDGNTQNGDSCSSICQVTTPTATNRPKSDFNGDGRSDIAWRNGTTGVNTIWRTGFVDTRQAVATVSNTAWRIVGSGDFDGNGLADLLWRNTSAGGANTIWRAANASTQTAVATLPAPWFVAGIGDFNADARSDIVWHNDTNGVTAIWLSGNVSTPQRVATLSNTQWRLVGVGDFNGDGRSDLLWRNVVTGANMIWRTANASSVQTVTPVGTTWQVAGVGDFNADGVADIFLRNNSTGGNVIWRSANSATRTGAATVGTAWRVATIADYNGDRRADVLWRHSSGVNTIWKSANPSTQQAVATLPTEWTAVP